MSEQPTPAVMDFAMFSVEAAPPPPVTASPAPVMQTEGDPPPSFDHTPPSAEEMAAGIAGLSATPEHPAVVEAKPRRVVRFVEAEREQKVPLAHPVECDDVVYDSIVVRRMNVADFFAHFSKVEGERGRFPCFFDVRGEGVPDEVLDALSLDDSSNVNEAYQHFLPASFRAEPAPSSTPSNGEASPPS